VQPGIPEAGAARRCLLFTAAFTSGLHTALAVAGVTALTAAAAAAAFIRPDQGRRGGARIRSG
jgi:hypothetical protein